MNFFFFYRVIKKIDDGTTVLERMNNRFSNLKLKLIEIEELNSHHYLLTAEICRKFEKIYKI